MTDEEFLNQPPQWRPQGIGELARLIDLARAGLATRWRPIKTAPRDGSKFLAYWDGDVEVVHWEMGLGCYSESWYQGDQGKATLWMPIIPPAELPKVG